MMKNNIKCLRIVNYMDEMFPDARCELNYNKDYELLIAVVLSAQTTDKRVNSVTEVLFREYDNLEALSGAKIDSIASIIKPIGTFQKKAVFVKEIATILHDKYNDKVPNNRNKLEKLPGVGRKTASVVLSNLFDVPSFAVDTHVSRVSKRLGLAKENDSVEQVEDKLKRKFERRLWSRLHHQFVLFGRYKCRAISPLCNECKLKEICKNKKNN